MQVRTLVLAASVATVFVMSYAFAQTSTGTDPDIQTLMTRDDLHKSGLDKLSSEQLKALNRWLSQYTRVLAREPSKVTAEVRWERMRQCAEQVNSLAVQLHWSDEVLAGSIIGWSSHYNPKYERCFVTLSQSLAKEHKDTPDLPLVVYTLFDAFENKQLASATDWTLPSVANFCSVEDTALSREEIDKLRQTARKRGLSRNNQITNYVIEQEVGNCPMARAFIKDRVEW